MGPRIFVDKPAIVGYDSGMDKSGDNQILRTPDCAKGLPGPVHHSRAFAFSGTAPDSAQGRKPQAAAGGFCFESRPLRQAGLSTALSIPPATLSANRGLNEQRAATPPGYQGQKLRVHRCLNSRSFEVTKPSVPVTPRRSSSGFHTMVNVQNDGNPTVHQIGIAYKHPLS